MLLQDSSKNIQSSLVGIFICLSPLASDTSQDRFLLFSLVYCLTSPFSINDYIYCLALFRLRCTMKDVMNSSCVKENCGHWDCEWLNRCIFPQLLRFLYICIAAVHFYSRGVMKESLENSQAAHPVSSCTVCIAKQRHQLS